MVEKEIPVGSLDIHAFYVKGKDIWVMEVPKGCIFWAKKYF